MGKHFIVHLIHSHGAKLLQGGFEKPLIIFDKGQIGCDILGSDKNQLISFARVKTVRYTFGISGKVRQKAIKNMLCCFF